jgi:hypothetical protein
MAEFNRLALQVQFRIMVDFQYWYESLISEAELITSKEALVRKWVNKEAGITSAYDQHELLE